VLELTQAQASTGMKRMEKHKQKTKRTENRANKNNEKDYE
jgi:hypothetical protein